MIDQQIVQQLLNNLNETTSTHRNLLVDTTQDIAANYRQQISDLSDIIAKQRAELSLFHLFEAHADAGKVSDQLWTDIKNLLKQARADEPAQRNTRTSNIL